jgi:hypothetical protein
MTVNVPTAAPDTHLCGRRAPMEMLGHFGVTWDAGAGDCFTMRSLEHWLAAHNTDQTHQNPALCDLLARCRWIQAVILQCASQCMCAAALPSLPALSNP